MLIEEGLHIHPRGICPDLYGLIGAADIGPVVELACEQRFNIAEAQLTDRNLGMSHNKEIVVTDLESRSLQFPGFTQLQCKIDIWRV
jgi:hypothetical protein